jgi:hypothetical protein
MRLIVSIVADGREFGRWWRLAPVAGQVPNIYTLDERFIE